MSGDERDDHTPRGQRRPWDPAGTQPRHDPDALLPEGPPITPPGTGQFVEGDAVEVEGETERPAIDDEAPGLGPAGDDGDLLPERRAAAGVGATAAAPVAAPHAPRFHFLYGALAAVALAVVVAGGYALLHGSDARDRAAAARAGWSPWQPKQGSVAGAAEIASHVGAQYRLSDGRQLVTVEASELSIGTTPLTVAIRKTPAQGGDIQVFGDNGLMYRLCGLGKNCSIPFGKKSTARQLLLRRESLELALYTFRYLDGVDQVVVLLPPAPKQKPSIAVYFRRGDVGPQLARPLRASLAPTTPSVTSVRSSADASFVDHMTNIHQFAFSLVPANTENRGFLVLDPLGATPSK